MDRFFSDKKGLCVLMICALLLGSAAGAGIGARAKAQPVFFSMLFPQLTPDFAFLATDGEALEREAVFL